MADDSQWLLLRCPECKGLLKVQKSFEGKSLACPTCSTVVGLPDQPAAPAPEQEAPREPRKPASPSNASVLADPTKVEISVPKNSLIAPAAGEEEERLDPLAPREKAIPDSKKGAYKPNDDLLVTDANSDSSPPEWTGKDKPRLDNLDKLGSTADEDLQMDPDAEAPERRTDKRIEKDLTGWDSDEEEDEEEALGGRNPKPQSKLFGLIRLAALPVLGILLALFVLQGIRLLSKKDNAPPPQANTVTIGEAGLTELESDAINDSAGVFDEASVTVKEFLEAKTWQERSKFVRDSERVAPLMERYYSAHPDGPLKYREIKNRGYMQVYKGFLVTEVLLQDYSEKTMAVERLESGEYKIDWESYVGYSDMEWKDFRIQRPVTKVLFRAVLEPGDYYNFGFTEDEFDCYLMEDIGGENQIYGYIEKDSDFAIDFALNLKGQASKRTMRVVKVRFPDAPKSDNQVLIVENLQDGWVFREEDPSL